MLKLNNFHRVLLLICISFIVMPLVAQELAEGQWDCLMRNVNNNQYVYALDVYNDNILFGGNILYEDVFSNSRIKGFGQYSSTGRVVSLDGGVHGPDFEVRAILTSENGVYIGGKFNVVCDVLAYNIAKWNGVNWEALQWGVNSTVFCLEEYEGDIYVGGEFSRVNGSRLWYLARWNGSDWSSVGEPLNGPVHSMTVYNGALVVGGRFTQAGDLTVNHLAVWKDGAWSALNEGTNGNVLSMAVQGDDLIIAGRFETAGSQRVDKITRWNGTAFESLDQGLSGNVYSVAVDGDYIYAGGEFTHALGYETPLNHIGRWNGSVWERLGDGLDGPVHTIAVHRSDVYIGGRFQVDITTFPWWVWWFTFKNYGSNQVLRWRNSVPETPFRQRMEEPFMEYTDWTSGVAWRDYDNDGDEDIIIGGWENNVVLSNNSDGSFQRENQGSLMQGRFRSRWADYDNDGDEDFIGLGWKYGHEKGLMNNQGGGVFYEAVGDFSWSPVFTAWTGSWGDFNNDGYVDFMLCNVVNGGSNSMMPQVVYQYTNVNGKAFSVEAALKNRSEWIYPSSVNWSDFDNDGDIDIYLCQGAEAEFVNDEPQHIYLNDGQGHFEEVEIDGITGEYLFATSGVWGDYDNDGDFDLVITTNGFQNNELYENLGGLEFRKVTESPVCLDEAHSFDASWCDYDNDGDLDLFIMNGHHGDNFMYENLGNGELQRVYGNQFTQANYGSGTIAWHDYDRDGDQDMIMVSDEYSMKKIHMFENTTEGNHWLNLRLEGIKSNRNALGAKVHVKAVIDGEMITQTREVNNSTWLSQSSLEQVIGLGDAANADVMIEWPSGIWQMMEDVGADQFITIVEDTANAMSKLSGVSAREALDSDLLDETLEMESSTPSEFSLSPCYPNPFNPSTEIVYTLPRSSRVQVHVLNARGEVVQTLIQETQQAGNYQIRWNGLDQHGNAVPSGLYLCRLEADGFVSTQKMLLVR
ncbi:FG-GAP-like repeat-containing protein [bacterium]